MRFSIRAAFLLQAVGSARAASYAANLPSLAGTIAWAGSLVAGVQAKDAISDHNCQVYGADGVCAMAVELNESVQRFRNDEGEMEFKWTPCDDEMMEDANWEEVTEVKSMYQTIIFEESLPNEDKCLTLDDSFQQCTSFRPHYHEPAVHFPAAYLESVRRVVFVGGGDSMILHEVLKYPTVEVVLGLELDQKVVRQSFKHFLTQPHFDDERVQWWFGDGAKTITMLPRDFFGTFDLVILDLSETVMSLSVTKHLDIFQAMSLLLKPDGILVKNDFGYFEKLSKVFKYALQINWQDIPYICNQEFVLVSHDIDFLKPNFKLLEEYKPETLLYKPLEDINWHYGFITDYSNNASPGTCQSLEDEPGDDESDDDKARAGILMVVEAENASGPLHPATEVENALLSAVKKTGLTPLSAITYTAANLGVMSVIAMSEGYVVAHTLPASKYCAFDIQLWGRFEMLGSARSALLDAVGSGDSSWSSYRIVVGGMIGTKTWNEDKQTIGPDLSTASNCDKQDMESSSEERPSIDQETVGIAIEEGMKLLKDEDLAAVVICGDRAKEDRCIAIDAVKKHKSDLKTVVALWNCPADGSGLYKAEHFDSGVFHVPLCEKDAVKELRSRAEKYKGLSAIVIDPNADSAAVNNAHGLWISEDVDQGGVFREGAIFMVPILDESDTERIRFLKHRDNALRDEPDFRVEINLAGDKSMTFGLVVPGTPEMFQLVSEVAKSIEERSSVETEVRRITLGGAIRDQPEHNPIAFDLDDYDRHPGREQFLRQRPLGSQTIFQLAVEEEKEGAVTTDKLSAALGYALSKMDMTSFSIREFTDVGDGALLVGPFLEGHAIVVWDGAMRVDINLFTFNEGVDHEKGFVSYFLEMGLPAMKFLLRDEQPRGNGRVVNFSNEIDLDGTLNCFDNYDSCDDLKSDGWCDGEVEKNDEESKAEEEEKEKLSREWMQRNCKDTCGLCGVSDESKNVHSEL